MSGPQVVMPVVSGVISQANHEAMMQAIIDRTVRGRAADAVMLPLPSAAARANRLLVFDSLGNPITAEIPGAGTSLTGDASLATVTASGGPTRTLAEWTVALGRESFDIRNLTWGGSATAAEQAASLNEAVDIVNGLGGGEIVIPPGSYDLSDQVVVDKPFVRIRGAGETADSDYVGQIWATRLRWTGSSGATMIVAAPVSAGTSRRLFGFGIHDLFLDGNLLAARGLEMRSQLGGQVSGLMFTKFSGSTGALYLGVVDTLGAGEARDIQNCVLRDLYFRQLAAEGTSDCIRLDGDGVANTSFNIFRNIICKHANNHAFLWGNSDNNHLDFFRAFRPSGTGYGMIYSADADLLRTSRSNRASRIFAQGGVLAQGTGVAANPSYNNLILDYDIENGSPVPTIDTGASLEWWSEYVRVRTGQAGAQTMANGMIEQWGANEVGASTAIDVTFPVALDSGGGYSAMATIRGTGAVASASPCQAQIKADGTGITLANLSTETVVIAWRAIGRVT